MKKLMIAAFAATFAVAAQAAAINWSSNNKSLTDDKGAAVGAQLTGYTLVLVNLGSTINWDNATIIPTGSSTEQTTVAINTATSSKRGRVTGKISFAYDASDTDSNLVNNGDYIALMFVDGDNKLSKLVYSSSGDEVGNEAVWKVAGLLDNTTSIAASTAAIGLTGNFTAAPEPTSGLLMLLGMAGLALRRRRA